MLKFLPFIFVVLIIIIFFGAKFFLNSSNISTIVPEKIATITSLNSLTVATPSGTLESRVMELEFTVTDLMKKVKDLPASNGSSDETRIKTLETSVNDLKSRVAKLEGASSVSSTTQTTTSVSKTPVYIPLGWIGSSSATDWISIVGQDIVINSADYSGYTSMQFEVSLRAYQGNGKAFARLIDKDSGVAVQTSEVSNTSQDYTWVSSVGFTLASSQKTYRLQLKSLTGYSTDVQNARIKVNF